MSGFTTQTVDHIIRAELWSNELKDVLQDELMGMRYVRIVQDFPDGDILNIPSIGQMEAQDYEEDQAVQYTAMETGNFQFQVTEYKQAGTYVTNKMKQDSYRMAQIEGMFVPKMTRAIMKQVEIDILSVGPNNQTAADTNSINSAQHRFVAGGLNNIIVPQDFAKARFALNKANVPLTNLVAIVDPSVEYHLSTMTNLVNVSFNPRWEGVIRDGISTGMQFKFNIYGWDVYVSQNLLANTGSETIDGTTAAAGAVNNLFFSATPDVLPFIGSIRQTVKVDSKYNMDRQRDEYVTTMRYGFDLYRPENLVCILSASDQVYA
jgi:hypothetical protein